MSPSSRRYIVFVYVNIILLLLLLLPMDPMFIIELHNRLELGKLYDNNSIMEIMRLL